MGSVWLYSNMFSYACIVLLGLLTIGYASRLSVQSGHFQYGGQRVFLSGGNLPWIYYGYDFGDHQWNNVKSKIEDQLKQTQAAGGNSIRLWVHIQGETTPAFDNNGYVTAPDHQGTLLDDIKDLLDTAQKYNILVFPTLWNMAVNQDSHHRLDGLVRDHRKLQSYIDKVLKPMVTKAKGHPALGGWDIINEPEGMVIPDQSNSDKCFDTRALHNSGAGWAGKKYSYTDILRFINWQADAIKTADSGALVTMGVWNPKSNTDNFHMVNHYSDACLRKAGGKTRGTLDFYQFHSYSWQGHFDNVAPFKNSAGDYGLNKPIVVGEFWEQAGGGMKIDQLFDYIYNHGYGGAWSWDLMNHGQNQRHGMTKIKGYTSHGKIPISM